MASPIIGIQAFAVPQPYLAQINHILQLPVLDSSVSIESLPAGQFVLQLDENGAALAYTGRKQPGAIRVDFTGGSAQHRRQFGGGKGQMIAKAIGLKGAYKPAVLDLTAGLGQDAFVLACLGCTMTLVERSGIVYSLLNDGLERALEQGDSDLRNIVQTMQLHRASGLDFLASLTQNPDVIYLDPMFPSREKAAKVKKEMQAFHQIVGADDDAGELLVKALDCAKYRVVIKRPRIAPAIHEQYPACTLPAPGLVLTGKSSRYDIYPLAKMPTI